MNRITNLRRLAAIGAAICAVAALSAGTASAGVSSSAVTKTLSFIGKPNSATSTGLTSTRC